MIIIFTLSGHLYVMEKNSDKKYFYITHIFRFIYIHSMLDHFTFI